MLEVVFALIPPTWWGYIVLGLLVLGCLGYIINLISPYTPTDVDDRLGRRIVQFVHLVARNQAFLQAAAARGAAVGRLKIIDVLSEGAKDSPPGRPPAGAGPG